MTSKDLSRDGGPLSRTEKKRQSRVLEDLAAELVSLGPDDILGLPVGGELQGEILRASKITEHGARKREIKYLARRLRRSEHQVVESVMAHMALRHDSKLKAVELEKSLERLRSRLLEPDSREEALNELAMRYPRADVVRIRKLIERCTDWVSPQISRDILRYLQKAAELSLR